VREIENTYPKADQITHSKESNKSDKMLKTMQRKPKQSKTTHAIKNSTSEITLQMSTPDTQEQ
jgi:hypothetical protein